MPRDILYYRPGAKTEPTKRKEKAACPETSRQILDSGAHSRLCTYTPASLRNGPSYPGCCHAIHTPAWTLDGDGVRAWLTSGAWESRRAGRLSSSSPLLNNKIARPGSVPPSVAVSPRICYLRCLPCLYTHCTKELLRPTVGLLCLRQGLWIRTRKVLCCPRAGTRWRTFCTQRYSKDEQQFWDRDCQSREPFGLKVGDADRDGAWRGGESDSVRRST
jgi:hypothetical protein